MSNSELVDVFGFIDDHLLLHERLLKCQKILAGHLLFSVNEKDRQVLVRVWTRQAIPAIGGSRHSLRFGRLRSATASNQKSCEQSEQQGNHEYFGAGFVVHCRTPSPSFE